tara:strand:- start:2670 stop:3098 length:429 start_codon:yes stop_codon:yes gene_type:complete
LFRLLSQSQQVQNHFWTKPFDLEYVGKVFYQFIAPPRWSPASMVIGLGVAQAVFLLLILLLILLLLGRRPTDLYLFIAIFVSFLVTIIYSVMSRNIFVSRYFLFAHLLLLVAIAVLVCRIPSIKLRISTCILVLGLLLYSCF